MPSFLEWVIVIWLTVPTLTIAAIVALRELREARLGARRYELTELARQACSDPLELWYQLGPDIEELGDPAPAAEERTEAA